MLNKIIKTIKKYFVNSKKYCPVCQSEVDLFLPLSEQFKGNVIIKGKVYQAYKQVEMLNHNEYSCPNCGASDRERFYAIYMKNIFFEEKKLENVKMVHFAPENSLKKFLQQFSFCEYRTADLMMDGVDDKADLTNLHIYESNYFDFFICSHMLEHIPDDLGAMKELYRILKSGGKGILVVPILEGLDEIYEDATITSEKERLINFGQEDHIRMYNKRGFLERLRSVGFKIEEFNINNFSKKLFINVGISDKSCIYIVTR